LRLKIEIIYDGAEWSARVVQWGHPSEDNLRILSKRFPSDQEAWTWVQAIAAWAQDRTFLPSPQNVV
jgi:hypothetical protein